MFLIPLLSNQDVSSPTTVDTLALSENLRRIVGQSHGFDSTALAEALNAVAVSFPILETWPGADVVASLDGLYPWVLMFGTGAWHVTGGAAELQGIPSSPAQVGRLNVNLGRSDYRVTATIDEWAYAGTNLLVVGPCLRMQGDASLNFYSPIIISVDGVSTASIQRFQVGTGQTQIGPSVPVTPHAGMRIGAQVEGDLIGLYIDDARAFAQHDPTGILTGAFCGMQGVATGTNRVRVGQVLADAVDVDLTPTVADTIALTEGLQRAVTRRLAEGPVLSEGLARFIVKQKGLAEQPAFTEILQRARAASSPATELLGLFEALGVTYLPTAPQVRETVVLTEALSQHVSARAAQELVNLTESLSRVFRGQVHIGVLKLMNESVLVSGTGVRSHVTARGIVRVPVPEQSGLEYTADLVGRDGVIVQAADLATLQVTVYNLADLAIINGVNRASIVNTGRGIIDANGHLTVTLDADDTPILDATKPYEHHILLLEGTYDGGQRAFRRTLDHVVINMARVP